MQPERPTNYWQPQDPSDEPQDAPAYPQQPSASDTPTVAPSVSVSAPQPQQVPSEPLAPQPFIETQDPTPESTPSEQQQPVYWQAHEYIHHEKDTVWFVIFGIVVAAFTLMAIFVIRSWTFAILVPVMAAALIVYTRRPPRLLDYTLTPQGLYINDQLYNFGQFKSFGIIRDGDEHSLMLIPIQRFKPGVTVYFPEQSGEAIVDLLGSRLPMKELHMDVVDKIVRKLRL